MTGRLAGVMIQDASITTTQLANNSVGHAQMTDNSVGNDEMRNNSVGTDEIIDLAVTTAKVADEAITTAKIAPTARPSFTQVYTSSQLTISNAGGGTLGHGLATAPTLIEVFLVCTTAELGYSIGETIVWGTFWQSQERGLAVSYDATNLYYRYVAQATPFSYVNKSSGASSALTNANWRAVIRAWA